MNTISEYKALLCQAAFCSQDDVQVDYISDNESMFSVPLPTGYAERHGLDRTQEWRLGMTIKQIDAERYSAEMFVYYFT